MISLETGVVKDEHVLFKWDGKERQLPAWNKDTDMKDAFKNSTVWYYQELAKRIGEDISFFSITFAAPDFKKKIRN